MNTVKLLAYIAALEQSHTNLVTAVEDFANMALNSKAQERLIAALAAGRKVIAEGEPD